MHDSSTATRPANPLHAIPANQRSLEEVLAEQRRIGGLIEQLAQWLEEWITGDAPRKTVEKRLLYYAHEAKDFQQSQHPALYRGLSLPKGQIAGTTALVTPRAGVALEAWTANRLYAEFYAAKAGRNGVVLTAAPAQLDIFLDTDLFDAACPLCSWQAGEVLVRPRAGEYACYRP